MSEEHALNIAVASWALTLISFLALGGVILGPWGVLASLAPGVFIGYVVGGMVYRELNK